MAAVAAPTPSSRFRSSPTTWRGWRTSCAGAVVAEDPFLTEIASHLINAGGKRVRPAFSVTSAATAGPAMARGPRPR